MKITEVRIYKTREAEEGSNFRGTASITIDDVFVVHNIAIVEGRNGLFVSFPDRKLRTGRWVDVAHPVNTETRQAIQDAILEKYNEAE